MSAILGMLRTWYRTIVPATIRQSRLLAGLRRLVYDRLLSHDAIYDSHYYASDVEGPAVSSAPEISQSIKADLQPNTVVDVGCGTGALLQALREKDCQVFGLEYSEAALQYCRNRGVGVQKFDLEKDDFGDNRTFDVAVSLEVGEHLSEKSADRYVKILAQLSDVIVFTACPPGPGGHDHVNEQPPAYWISKFQASGFSCDEKLSSRWRESWQRGGSVASWYHENLMVFRRVERV